jgi:hypothetical protein
VRSELKDAIDEIKSTMARALIQDAGGFVRRVSFCKIRPKD